MFLYIFFHFRGHIGWKFHQFEILQKLISQAIPSDQRLVLTLGSNESAHQEKEKELMGLKFLSPAENKKVIPTT